MKSTTEQCDDFSFFSRAHEALTAYGRSLGSQRAAQEVQSLAVEAWRRAQFLASAPACFHYVGPTRAEYVVGPVAAPQRFMTRAAGASALSIAVLNQGQWVQLPAGRTRVAWHASIAATIEAVARIDLATANALAFAAREAGGGTRLSTCGDRVFIRWRPGAGRSGLMAAVPLSCAP